MFDNLWLNFIFIHIQLALPLLLLALAVLVSEQVGVHNIAIEAMMGVGLAIGYTMVQLEMPLLGLLAGALGGGLVAAVFGLWILFFGLRLDISGLVLTLFVSAILNLLSFYFPLAEESYAMVYLPYLILVVSVIYGVLYWQQHYSRWGLILRSLSFSDNTAYFAGLNPLLVRFMSLCASGLIAGFAGAFSAFFMHETPYLNGSGWMALALVAIARWNYLVLFLTTLLFSVAVSITRAFSPALGLTLDSIFWIIAPIGLLLILLVMVSVSANFYSKPVFKSSFYGKEQFFL